MDTEVNKIQESFPGLHKMFIKNLIDWGCVCVCVCVSRSVVCDFLQPHRL